MAVGSAVCQVLYLDPPGSSWVLVSPLEANQAAFRSQPPGHLGSQWAAHAAAQIPLRQTPVEARIWEKHSCWLVSQQLCFCADVFNELVKDDWYLQLLRNDMQKTASVFEEL